VIYLSGANPSDDLDPHRLQGVDSVVDFDNLCGQRSRDLPVQPAVLFAHRPPAETPEIALSTEGKLN